MILLVWCVLKMNYFRWSFNYLKQSCHSYSRTKSPTRLCSFTCKRTQRVCICSCHKWYGNHSGLRWYWKGQLTLPSCLYLPSSRFHWSIFIVCDERVFYISLFLCFGFLIFGFIYVCVCRLSECGIQELEASKWNWKATRTMFGLSF